ncbi:MAG: hypothetical protein M3Q92_11720, partial [Actinomycetota bacterium]|nr:hypothetical protein [Actinomycetota bacterium]
MVDRQDVHRRRSHRARDRVDEAVQRWRLSPRDHAFFWEAPEARSHQEGDRGGDRSEHDREDVGKSEDDERHATGGQGGREEVHDRGDGVGGD